MANENQAIIDVVLAVKQAKGAQTVVKDTMKTFESLQKQVDDIGRQLEKSPEKFTGHIKKIQAALKYLSPAIDEARLRAVDFFNDFGSISTVFSTAENRIESYKNKLKSLQKDQRYLQAQLDPTNYRHRRVGTSAEINNSYEKYKALENNVYSLTVRERELSESINTQYHEIAQYNTELRELTQHLKSIAAESKNGTITQKAAAKATTETIRAHEIVASKLDSAKQSYAQYQDEYRKVVDSLSSSKAELESAKAEWERFSSPIQYSEQELAQFRNQLEQTTAQIAEYESEIEKSKGVLSEGGSSVVSETLLDKLGTSEFIQFWNAFNEGAERAGADVANVQERLDSLYNLMGLNSHTEVVDSNSTQSAGKSINRIANSVSMLRTGFNRASEIVRGFLRILTKIGKTASRVFSTMWRGIKSLGSRISKVASKISDMFKDARKNSAGFNLDTKKLTKTFIQFGLGVRSLYFLIRRLRTEFVSAMKELAKEFPEINAQLSEFTMSVKRYKGSFTTMIQPIASAVIPTLVNLLNVLTAVNEKLAVFFATLTGQTVIYRAVADNVDYAESVDEIAESAEEAKKELAAYDNLLVITTEDTEDNADTKTSDVSDLGYTFEKVNIEDRISEFARQLKSAWEEEDFEGVGELVAQKLNSVVDAVDDWITDTFEPEGVEWANRIARVINGFFNNWDAEKTGETISAFFNAIFKIINEFITTIDWEQAGTRIGELITGAIANFDAEEAGITLGNFWKGVCNLLLNALQNIDWAELGTKVGEFVNGAINGFDGADVGLTFTTFAEGVFTAISSALDKINWGKLGRKIASGINNILGNQTTITAFAKTIAKAINSATTLLANFNDTINWDNIAKSINSGISTFLTETDFAAAGSNIFRLLGGALDAAITVTGNQDNWDLFADDVVKFITNLNWGELLGKASELAGNILGGLVSVLITYIESGDLKTQLEAWGSKLGTAIKNLPWGDLFKAIPAFGDAIFSGIGVAIENATGLPEGTGKIIAEGIGAAVLATKFLGLVSAITGGGGLLSAFRKKDKALDTQKGKLNTELSTVVKLSTVLGGALVAAVGLVVNALGQLSGQLGTTETELSYSADVATQTSEAIETSMTTAADTVGEAFQQMSTDESTAMQNIKEGATTTWESVESDTVTAANNMSTAVNDSATSIEGRYTTMGTVVLAALAALATGLSTAWGTIELNTEASINSISSTISTGFGTAMSNMIEALYASATAVYDWGLNTTQNIYNTVSSWVENISSGVSVSYSNIRSWILGTADAIYSWGYNTADNIMNTVSSWVSNIGNGLVSAWNSLANWASSLGVSISGWWTDSFWPNTLNTLTSISVGVLSFSEKLKNFGGAAGLMLPVFGAIPLLIPGLAQGAVIPPNKEFLAVLGDQRHGTNIEAPLDTIKQAVAEVLTQMGGAGMPEQIQVVMPDGRVLAETVWDEEEKLYKQTGSYYPKFA